MGENQVKEDTAETEAPERKIVKEVMEPPLGKDRIPPPGQMENGTLFSGKFLIVLCLGLSIASGIISGWWFSGKDPVLTIDIKKIVEEKKKELQEKYKKNPTDATAKEMRTELEAYLGRLEKGVNLAGSGGQLVLLADVVLSGGGADVTEQVSKYADGK